MEKGIVGDKEAMTRVIEYLKRLGRLRFWGDLTLTFKAGEVVNIKRVENLKAGDI